LRLPAARSRDGDLRARATEIDAANHYCAADWSLVPMKNLKIGVRLAAGFTIVALFMIGSTVFGLYRMGQMADGTALILQNRYPQVRIAQELMNAQNLKVRAASSLLVATDPRR
jgi:hypothetical protein